MAARLNKKVKDEVEVFTLTGNELWRISMPPYNNGTNRKILSSNIKLYIGSRLPAIIVTAGSFTGNNAPPIAALSGLTPDTQFMVYGGGVLLEVNTDYTFAGTTITVPTGATTLRVVIL